jgi:predicted nucleic acid-binding protein
MISMQPRVYLETTVPSYLAARPGRDLIRAAHQQITRDWWDANRTEFELVVSQLVVRECSAGDPDAAAARLALIADLPLVAVTDAATALAARLSAEVPFPSRAAADALHIAVAAVHGVEFLLTWNCRHIANAVIRLRVEFVCRNAGYHVPVICTPEELTRESRDADG